MELTLKKKESQRTEKVKSDGAGEREREGGGEREKKTERDRKTYRENKRIKGKK